MNKLFFVLFFICGLFANGIAQVATQEQIDQYKRTVEEQTRKQQQYDDEQQRRAEQKSSQKATQDFFNPPIISTKSRFKNLITGPFRTPEENQRLSPDSQDVKKYESFLKSKKTGIFKIYPDINCESKYLVTVEKDCENYIPFSVSYSFLRKNYGVDNFFDIRLQDEKLYVDGFLTQNIIVSIGDVPLESVSSATNGIKFIADFQPTNKSIEAKNQFNEIAKNIFQNGFIYGKATMADNNTTYLLRLVAYRISFKQASKYVFRGPDTKAEKELLTVNDDSTRRDKIIAFRIIRKESDGNITIIWKELSDKKSPLLNFERKCDSRRKGESEGC